VARLIEAELATAGELERGNQPEALVAHRRCELDSLGLELGDGRLDLVTHEIELVPTTRVCGMGGQLGRGQGEDEPAAAGVDRGKAEDVAEEGAIGVGVATVDDGVSAGDRGVDVPRAARRESIR
jgi:hypothetical protein